jgi:hypothetical protein
MRDIQIAGVLVPSYPQGETMDEILAMMAKIETALVKELKRTKPPK